MSILALLDLGPSYGLRLKNEFEARTGGIWPLNVGQVYSTLDRLEREGLVRELDHGGDRQRTHEITPPGRERVAQWFSTPLEEPPSRDPLVLKLVMAARHPGIDTSSVIQAERRGAVELLQRYTRLKRDPEADEDLGWSFLVDSMIFKAEARVRWLDGGLDRPTSGTVRVEGGDLAALGPAELARLRRRRVGFVFQQLNLIDGLTALENVSLPLELDGVRKRPARTSAARALSSMGIEELGDRFPDELSGGEQQRVAIARAVVGDRTLLLADEPTGALDSVTGESVLRLLRMHCDGGGSGVLVTHDARFAAWADRVVFLRDGRVADQTSAIEGPESLLDASRG